MLRVKSQKQYDKTLADLREVGVNTTMLSGWERLAHNPNQTIFGYALSDGFCSDGVGDEYVDLGTLDSGGVTDCIIESQLGLGVSEQDKICTTIKEFIAAVKAQRSGESK